MQRFLYLICLLLSLSSAPGQVMQPRYIGMSKWVPAKNNAEPILLKVAEKKFRFKKIPVTPNRKTTLQRKIAPHTRVISFKSLAPALQPVFYKSKKLATPQMVNAPSLLVRDNAVFNVSYTDKQHGFVADNTSDFTEDDEHTIWIAAGNKLIRYDGVHYFIYSEANGFPNVNIISLSIDKQKRIWIGSDKGAYYLQHDSLFTLYTKELDFGGLSCNKLITDQNGNTWLATKNNGAIKVEPDGVRMYTMTAGLPVNNIQTITIARNGDIWMGLREGIIVVKPDRIIEMFANVSYMKLRIINHIQEEEDGFWIGGFFSGLIHLGHSDTVQYSFNGRFDDRIYDIKKAPGGLWLSIYGGGLCYFNGKKNLEINAATGLVSSASYFLLKDSFGNIWVSDLSNGFSRLNENSFYEEAYPYKGLWGINSILPDKKKGRWLFTQGAGLFYEKDGSLTLFDYVRKDGIRPLNFPMDGVLNADGSLWAGSYGAGISHIKDLTVTQYEYGTQTEHHVVPWVKKDRAGIVWFGTLGFGIVSYRDNHFLHYSNTTGLINNTPAGLFLDADKKLYAAFSSGLQQITGSGIATLHIGNTAFRQQVNCFFSTAKGIAYIATENNGLFILHENKVYQLSEQNGLLSNQVKSVQEDSLGRIWVTSGKGIEYFEMESSRIKTHNQFNQSNGSYIIKAGNILLTNEGLPFWDMGTKKLVYDASFTLKEKNGPFFYIKKISVDEQPVDISQTVSVLPDQKIKINFTTVCWGRENNMALQCLLISSKGDTSIRFPENRSIVEIGDIIPGKYKLLFRAEDNKQMFYSIPLYLTIRNFWYNTFLFRMAVLAMLALATITYFTQKARRQKALNKLLSEKVNEQTKELLQEKEALLESHAIIDQQVQEKDILIQEINHRVKNNLQFIATILNMQIRSDKKKDATESLLETSRRLTAMSLVHELLYDDNIIKGLSIKKYIFELIDNLKEMAVDSTNPILFRIDVDDILINSKSAIAMGVIISELVSNSLKHAFKKIDNPEISIQLSGLQEYGRIRLVIRDNGTGFDPGSRQSNGLGMRLVDIFSRQLEGDYSISNADHFQYTLECKCI